MSPFPNLVRGTSPNGEDRYFLGDSLVDRYLEFVAGRVRTNTLRAVAFDLKTFFTVVDKNPTDVVAADIFDFLAHRRGDRRVVRLIDGESGLAARTIARRLSSVSGFYSYVIARDNTPLRANPVPRGLSTRRRGGRSTLAPLVRVPRTLPQILSPGEVDGLVGALRTHRDRAMVFAMVLGGLRRCEVLGLRLADIQVAERSLFIAEGKGGHQRIVPISNAFFTSVGDYLRLERPGGAPTDRVFVALKGPSRGHGLTAEGVDVIIREPDNAPASSGPPATNSATLASPDCGKRAWPWRPSKPRPVTCPSSRPGLPASHQRLAGHRVPVRRRSHRCRARRRTARPGGHQRMSPLSPPSSPGFPRLPPTGNGWCSPPCPQASATIGRYVQQLSTFLAPHSVELADITLRQLVRWMAAETDVTTVAGITRTHMENYKLWLSVQPGTSDGHLAKNTQRHRLRTIRIFFERLIEWDWSDAPTRNPLFHGDIAPAATHCPSS